MTVKTDYVLHDAEIKLCIYTCIYGDYIVYAYTMDIKTMVPLLMKFEQLTKFQQFQQYFNYIHFHIFLFLTLQYAVFMRQSRPNIARK